MESGSDRAATSNVDEMRRFDYGDAVTSHSFQELTAEFVLVNHRYRRSSLSGDMGIKKAKENESIGKLFVIFLRHADKSTLGRAMVESVILFTTSRGNASHVLRESATTYKVDTDAIAAKVKQEFAAKEKARTVSKPAPKVPLKAQPKTTRKTAAA